MLILALFFYSFSKIIEDSKKDKIIGFIGFVITFTFLFFAVTYISNNPTQIEIQTNYGNR